VIRFYAQILIGIFVGLLLYGEVTWNLILDWWQQPGASYGFLLPPIALGIAWRARHDLMSMAPAPDNRGLLCSLAACLIYLAGRLSSELFLQRFSLAALIAAAIWTFWGLRRLRILLFPWLLLLAAIPIPAILYNQVTVPLQLFVSSISARIVQALGITVYLDGNIIYLAHLSLGVAEACSGLRSLTALLIMALLTGHVQRSGKAARLSLMLLAVPVALGANIARIVLTAIAAEYDHRFAEGVFHSLSGWAVFVLGAAVFWLMGKILLLHSTPTWQAGPPQVVCSAITLGEDVGGR